MRTRLTHILDSEHSVSQCSSSHALSVSASGEGRSTAIQSRRVTHHLASTSHLYDCLLSRQRRQAIGFHRYLISHQWIGKTRVTDVITVAAPILFSRPFVHCPCVYVSFIFLTSVPCCQRSSTFPATDARLEGRRESKTGDTAILAWHQLIPMSGKSRLFAQVDGAPATQEATRQASGSQGGSRTQSTVVGRPE